jgi:hypothetical protein
MALFVLLFVCLDIAFPPPCAAVLESLSASKDVFVTVVIDSTSVEQAAAIKDSDSSPSPGETCRDEDCCFRCAHLLPHMPASNMITFDAQSVSWIVADHHLPSPALRGPYHPPRSI